MSERANKFMKDYKKSNHNSTATEDIVESLVALSENEGKSDAESKIYNMKENERDSQIKDEENNTYPEGNIISAAEMELEAPKTASKKEKKTGKKSEKKSNAGRKPFKTGDYKKITIDIPQELYDAMQDFLGAFDNNMTSYIKTALTNDINENYDEYVKKAKALKESKPILNIKRK